MSTDRHGVVVLAGPDIEGPLVQAIDAQGDHLVVVRRCADLAEVRAAGRSGIAGLAVVDAADPDLDAAVLEDLHDSGMSVVMIAPLDQGPRLRSLGADAVVQPGSPQSAVEALVAIVRAGRLPAPGHPGGPLSAAGSTPPAEPSPESPPTFPPVAPPPPPPPPPSRSAGGRGGPAGRAGDRRTGSAGVGAASTAGGGVPEEDPPAPASSSASPPPPVPARTHPLERLFARASDVARTDSAELTPRPCRVITVWGASGAPGRSTVALNVAVGLAALDRTPTGPGDVLPTAPTPVPPVLLVDADTSAASLAHMIGCPVDVSGVSVLARTSARGRLTSEDIARVVVPMLSGLGLVTGISVPQRWRELGPAGLTQVLHVARELARYVVVDVGAASLDPVEDELRHQGSRDDVVAAALRASDVVVAVARADAVGITRLTQALEWYEELGAHAELVLVANRVARESAGRRPVNAVAAALTSVAPGQLVHVIPEDPEVACALLHARAVADAAPRSAATRALLSLADVVAARPPDSPAGTRRPRRAPVRH